MIALGRALFDQFASDSVHGLYVLLRNRFNRNEAHSRSAHRFTDRLSVCGVVLVGLDVGFDKLRSNQDHTVAHRDERSCPVVGTATGFHANLASSQRAKVGQHVSTLQFLLENGLLKAIHAVELKHVLCNIHPNSANLHLGLLLSFGGLVSTKPPVWHLDAVEGGGVHPIGLGRAWCPGSDAKLSSTQKRVDCSRRLSPLPLHHRQQVIKVIRPQRRARRAL